MNKYAAIGIIVFFTILCTGLLVSAPPLPPLAKPATPPLHEPVPLQFELIQLDPNSTPALSPPKAFPYWSFQKNDKMCFKMQPTEAICMVANDRVPDILDVVYALAKEQQKSKCSQ